MAKARVVENSAHRQLERDNKVMEDQPYKTGVSFIG